MSKIFKIISLTIMTLQFFGCNTATKEELGVPIATGTWHGEFDMQGQVLPFNFQVSYEKGNPVIHLINNTERIMLDSIRIEGDSVFIPLHIFDTEIRAAISDSTMTGTWIKYYRDNYQIPFRATLGETDRFYSNKKTSVDLSAKWEMTFIHEEKGDTTSAIGIFEQQEHILTGTILTPTGDYRYLDGIVSGDSMKLSTFDGDHAFLFTGKYTNDTLKGNFWSGSHWYESFVAVKNENITLSNADTLTHLKKGYDKLSFSFPDLNGTMRSPEDYKGKVLILQLFGSWCPNCMDETKFLAEWYKKNKDRGVEILALAYEAKDDYDYARSRILKMKNKLNASYDFVIAGTKDKAAASKTLPGLNTIISFPTTIFIDKNGQVARIHTGFNGPGTGVYYEEFVKGFNATVDRLIEQ